jgi:hypothetical protein
MKLDIKMNTELLTAVLLVILLLPGGQPGQVTVFFE